MSGRFDDTTTPNYISMTGGSAGAAGTGAHTFVSLHAPQDLTSFHNQMTSSLYASATVTREMYSYGPDGIYGLTDFSTPTFGGMTNGTWYVHAITKAAGSNTYRMHAWAYNSGGTGTMTHGVNTSAAAHGDGSSITEIRIGSSTAGPSNGDIAVIGVWNSALSDANLDTLVSVNLSAWSALSPTALISLQNWTGSTGATDVAGTSTFSAVTGTVSSTSDPPSFNFTLSGTDATVTLLPAQANVTIHP